MVRARSTAYLRERGTIKESMVTDIIRREAPPAPPGAAVCIRVRNVTILSEPETAPLINGASDTVVTCGGQVGLDPTATRPRPAYALIRNERDDDGNSTRCGAPCSGSERADTDDANVE
jgi:hypothetical protein